MNRYVYTLPFWLCLLSKHLHLQLTDMKLHLCEQLAYDSLGCNSACKMFFICIPAGINTHTSPPFSDYPYVTSRQNFPLFLWSQTHTAHTFWSQQSFCSAMPMPTLARTWDEHMFQVMAHTLFCNWVQLFYTFSLVMRSAAILYLRPLRASPAFAANHVV